MSFGCAALPDRDPRSVSARPIDPRLILDAAPDAILWLTLDGRIAFANRAAADVLGVASDELVNRPIRSYIQFLGGHGNSGDSPAPTVIVELAGIDLPSGGEETCWREDGSSVPIEFECAPLEEEGELHGAVLTFRDISRRRSAQRLKDELIAITSHELRSPLTSVRSALGLVAAGHCGEFSAQGQRLLEIALTNADRLIRLVNDTLDLEQAEAGQLRMNSVVCDVGQLLVQAAEGMGAVAENVGVSIEVAPCDAPVWADPDRLHQVLTNLLANAIKFSPPSGGTVWLDAEVVGNELLIRVRDQGRGIPAAKLETIFERFVQVDDSDGRDKGGTGLGLAISRSIVKQHGGQIWAESTLGSGTTLCIALPYDRTVSAALAAA